MRATAALVVLVALSGSPAEPVQAPAAAQLLLPSDTGALANPLEEGGDVRVFVFVRRDCPIANRYSPEIARLPASFPSGVTFFLVYVDSADTAALIADHQREYGLSVRWFVDGEHALAGLAGVTVTPEAAVYSRSRRGRRDLVYRGRIDDRFLDVGRTRPAATTHELRDAVAAALEGRRAPAAAGPAIGCFIEDAR